MEHKPIPEVDAARGRYKMQVRALLGALTSSEAATPATVLGARLSYRIVKAKDSKGLECTCKLPGEVWLWHVEQLAPEVRQLAERTVPEMIPAEGRDPEKAPDFWGAVMLTLEDFFQFCVRMADQVPEDRPKVMMITAMAMEAERAN